MEGYEKFMKPSKVELEDLRSDKRIQRIMYLYHFNESVRRKGEDIAEYKISDWYVNLVESIQLKLQEEIAMKGIAIECNPTSNVLIGAFKDYEKHPLLQFNRGYRSTDDGKSNIFVSINTDDIGVFDTSLAHEYAMIFAAIRNKRHAEGNMNDEPIYEYMDYLRENGIIMSFRRRKRDSVSKKYIEREYE